VLDEDYIGRRVEELCEKYGVTKYRLSQITGITQTALAQIIEGKTTPTVHTIDKISDAFGLTLAQFFSSDVRPDLSKDQAEVLDLLDRQAPEERAVIVRLLKCFMLMDKDN
jgi:transcriptional regulator with XRE-family HTH domain